MSQFFDFGELLKPNKYGMFGLNSVGTKGTGYQNLSDPGGMLFGGSGEYNSLGMKRDGTKGGFFGDKAQGIDYAGSPVTAGTNMQGTARLAAILYGAGAGASAMGGGAAGGGMGSVGSSAVPMGAGGATAASGSGAAAGGGMAGLGAAGAASTGMDSGVDLSGEGTISKPGWMQYAKMGQQGMGMGRKNTYQPNMYMIDDTNNAEVLARLLREYAG